MKKKSATKKIHSFLEGSYAFKTVQLNNENCTLIYKNIINKNCIIQPKKKSHDFKHKKTSQPSQFSSSYLLEQFIHHFRLPTQQPLPL